MSYRVVEPHPSTPTDGNPAIHTSRGGAGNVVSLRDTTTTPGPDATGPPSAAALAKIRSRSNSNSRTHRAESSSPPLTETTSPSPSISPTRQAWSTGRGGAGNIRAPVPGPTERAALFGSFDEELERQLRFDRARAPAYHVGRGGAGNLVPGRSAGTSEKVARVPVIEGVPHPVDTSTGGQGNAEEPRSGAASVRSGESAGSASSAGERVKDLAKRGAHSLGL